MACGVTKVVDGNTVVCDNAGTSSHTGQHSGIIPNAYGPLINKRVWWTATDLSVGYKRVLVLGDKD